ncbi:LuxR family transcriptional regulator [Mumia sp.]|uniref:helix-turn-helix transcriptional regulator n=1 Tax=Mumia sp. TaxID=1965300 RepID=UPI00263873BA|nr:LuxR family transcriptional regulator [Mumia sp.]MDD9347301.1 AAA family ATPase [Mumia sp.]
MLVGRARECAAIGALVARARGGASGAVVVVGEAGIGKSTLLLQAREAAGSDVQVLATAGAEPERDLPFAGLAQLLRPLLGHLDALPAVQADALAQALALRPGGTGEAPARAGERFVISAATLGLISRAAEERPLLLLVDDLHHLDRPSVDAILFTARRLLTDAVAVVLATRPGAAVGELVADLDRLEVGGLSREECDALVVSRGLSATQAERLHAVSEGNPLAALEMVRTPDLLARDLGEIPVPRLIEEAFTGRLGSLPPLARTALTVAALAGDVDLTTLGRACATAGSDLAHLADAEQAELVDLGLDRVRFRHPLMQASLVQATAPPLRRQLHRIIADALPTGDLDRRAQHLSAATIGPDGEAAAVLDAATASAARRRAYAVASQWGERAAHASEDPEERTRRLALAGEHAWLGGLADRALEIFGEAVAGAPTGPARRRALALRGVVGARCGSLVEARALLLEASGPVAADDPDLAVVLLAEAVYLCVYLCDGAGARTVVARLDALRETATAPRSRLLGDLAAGIGRLMTGDGEAGATQMRRAVAAAGTGDLIDDPRWRGWLLLPPIWLRDSGDSRALVDAVVLDARERAALGTLPFLLFHAARDDATTDRWTSAEGAYREAIALARESGQRTDEAISRAGLAWLLARRGCEDEMRAESQEAERQCVRSRLNFGRAWLRFAAGDLAAGLGRYEEAVEHFRAQQSLVRRFRVVDADLSPAPELVECLVRVGDLDGARAEASAFALLADTKGQPWSRARAHRALALAGVTPDARFAAALVEHAHSPDAYERARTQLAFGAHLRRTRRRSEAREHLREALTTFDRLAAAPWAAQASAELAATGERVQRRAPGAEQPLTPQELQVARLLGEGRTTREAAAALFLSPKTVEYHLRHAYIKLGISSRAELAARLSEDAELRAPAG